MVKKLTLPLTKETVQTLKAGDEVLLSGILYTARDAAHKRLCEYIEQGKELPIQLENQTIYYVGPTPARAGMAVGSAGPTSSYRMDAYCIPLFKKGLRCMIGKGKRSLTIREAMQEYGVVYLGVIGGAAALISKSIKESKVIAFDDLGAEAIHEYRVEDFPAFVLMDCFGGNMYESEPKKYRVEE